MPDPLFPFPSAAYHQRAEWPLTAGCRFGILIIARVEIPWVNFSFPSPPSQRDLAQGLGKRVLDPPSQTQIAQFYGPCPVLWERVFGHDGRAAAFWKKID
jgi:hypothetical protein